jgi:SanA protein
MLKKIKYKYIWWAVYSVLTGVLSFSAILAINYARINQLSRNYIFSDISLIPEKKVGLVLGTSTNLRGGSPNPYFHNRIESAVELYKKGKIKYILVSGDNSTIYYNEPIQMKKALMKRGIPEHVIYLDYAGLRTLDSVVRCREVFKQNSFTIISQRFHNERAVFLARSKGIDAIAFNATDVKGSINVRMLLREFFARVKALQDLYTNKQPKFLGEQIIIGSE